MTDSITCHTSPVTKVYKDTDGNEKVITFEAGDWDFGTYTKNNCEYGIKQRIRELLYTIKGEIFTNNKYGFNWRVIVNHIDDFSSNNVNTRNNIYAFLTREIQTYLHKIDSVTEILDVKFEKKDSKVIFTIQILYQNGDENEIITESLSI